MSSTNSSPGGRPDPSIRELVAQASLDTSKLVSSQIELAKAELKQSAAAAGSAIALMIVAGVFLSLGLLFFFLTAAYGLHELGLPVWASFGIVTLFLLLLGLVLILIGKKRASGIKGPERSAAQMEITKQVIEDTATSALSN